MGGCAFALRAVEKKKKKRKRDFALWQKRPNRRQKRPSVEAKETYYDAKET
jgi:hypothetical protein